jgi:hypothetical protein
MGAPITVLDLITETLSIFGEYTPGEPLDAASVQSLLFTLNGAVDGMGAESLAIFANSVLPFTTAAGKQNYTLGPDPGNDWITAAAAPSEISRVGVVLNGAELPVKLLNADEWALQALKTLQSTLVSAVWLQYGPVSHTLTFWPIPTLGLAVNLYAAQQTPRFAALTDSVILPPGYQEFLTYDLVIKSASKFGAALPDWVPPAWREARTRIKEYNYQALESRSEDALLTSRGRGAALLRFYTGD